MTFAIAAAGTGGHVYPALSVADALVARGVPREEILFLGGSRFEAEVVPRAGFPFSAFELAKLRRSVSIENLRIPFVLRRTAGAMADAMERAGTRVVLGMSGYVTVPAAMAARRRSVPLFVQEQNASPGLAARFGARRAAATFVGLPGPSLRLPRAELVGNPLRSSIATFDRDALRAAARARYGLPTDGRVIGVLGGSLGARVLNRTVADIVATSGADGVLHLTGGDAYEEFAAQAASAGRSWTTRPFEPEMEMFYAACDLVVCRAGAMTVSELAATATPAILVPLARVGQEGNARSLADAGGAVIVEEEAVSSVPARAREILSDAAILASLAVAAGSEARPEAADTIAARLVEVVGA